MGILEDAGGGEVISRPMIDAIAASATAKPIMFHSFSERMVFSHGISASLAVGITRRGQCAKIENCTCASSCNFLKNKMSERHRNIAKSSDFVNVDGLCNHLFYLDNGVTDFLFA